MPEADWNSKTVPEEGSIVHVLAADSRGQYLVPFPVIFRGDTWWNASTGEELDTFIVAWRPAATKLLSTSNNPDPNPA